jgi:hypothetical protein
MKKFLNYIDINMILFETIDEYSSETGKLIGKKQVPYATICDYTGRNIKDFWGNPVIYNINYNDTDPCFGDHEAV